MLSSEELKQLESPDIDPVKAFIKNALRMKIEGDTSHYSHVVDQMRKQDDPETLWCVYVALVSCINELLRYPALYKELIEAFFSYKWDGDDRLSLASTYLLTHLVNSNSVYLIPSLRMLIKSFTQIDINNNDDTTNTTTTNNNTNINQNNNNENNIYTNNKTIQISSKHTRIHRTLQSLITSVPTGQSELFTVLEDNFPFKKHDENIQSQYLSQLFCICDYLPSMQQRILDLITRKCLEIDVEIVIEDSGNVVMEREERLVEEGEEGGDDLFMFDEDVEQEQQNNNRDRDAIPTILTNTTASNSNSKINNNNNNSVVVERERVQQIAPEVEEMAQKLDAMLSLVIRFIDTQINKGNEYTSRILFQLITIFEERILTAHRSKFVQFILFFVSFRVDRFAHMMSDRLLQIFRDDTEAHINRQTSVMYLASYCARGAFLPPAISINTIAELLSWCASFADSINSSHSRNGNNPNANANGDNIGGTTDDSYGDYDNNYHNHNNHNNNGYKQLNIYNHSNNNDTSLVLDEKCVTFCCCVQAICYILCFLGTTVADVHKNDAHLRYQWETVISCPIRPLRYCMNTVRHEFKRLVEYTGLIDPQYWSQLDMTSNDVHKYSSSSSSSPSKNNHNNNYNYDSFDNDSNTIRVDNFFPFDPCLLQSVNWFISQGYYSWYGIPGVDVDVELSRRNGTHGTHSRTESLGAMGDYNSYIGCDDDFVSSYDASSLASSYDSHSSSAMGSGVGSHLSNSGLSSSYGNNSNIINNNSYNSNNNITRQNMLMMQQQNQQNSYASQPGQPYYNNNNNNNYYNYNSSQGNMDLNHHDTSHVPMLPPTLLIERDRNRGGDHNMVGSVGSGVGSYTNSNGTPGGSTQDNTPTDNSMHGWTNQLSNPRKHRTRQLSIGSTGSW